MSDGIQLPAAADAYGSSSYKPTLWPTLPTVPTGGCKSVDPAFGACLMSEAPHTLHRTRWDGHEASWRDT